MERVTGLGGLFFKAADPGALYAWYEKHLGIKRGPDGSVAFIWRENDEKGKEGMTVRAIFPSPQNTSSPVRQVS